MNKVYILIRNDEDSEFNSAQVYINTFLSKERADEECRKMNADFGQTKEDVTQESKTPITYEVLEVTPE
jgi:hypothetical protein